MEELEKLCKNWMAVNKKYVDLLYRVWKEKDKIIYRGSIKREKVDEIVICNHIKKLQII